MEVSKDGKVWSACDESLGICISGRTKKEAVENFEKARDFRNHEKKRERMVWK